MNEPLGTSDAPREECGVIGVSSPAGDVAEQVFFGLFALQHRGQEAAGIVSFDGRRFHSERRMGLVGDNFSKRSAYTRNRDSRFNAGSTGIVPITRVSP
mgnify:CR=1 FL=1